MIDELFNKPDRLTPIRCPKCNKMLGKFSGGISEIKCPRCASVVEVKWVYPKLPANLHPPIEGEVQKTTPYKRELKVSVI